jgi:hypothetical protein
MSLRTTSVAVLVIAPLIGLVRGSTPLGEFRQGFSYPGLAAITEQDIRRDLFDLAGDEMRGREAGTLDELRAAAWLAEQARQAGLEPAGDDGTYYQFWPLRRLRVSSASTIRLDGEQIALWTEATIFSPVDAWVDEPLTFVGEATGEALDAFDLQGRAVAAVLTPPSRLPAPGASLWGWRYTNSAVRQRARALTQRGATAVVIVSDSIADAEFDRVTPWRIRGNYGRGWEDTRRYQTNQAPVIWVRRSLLSRVTDGQRLTARVSSESFEYPSANVIAKVPGTDPALTNEYILFSAHHDHDGIRAPVDGDSIYNGADDNASASVALLAIGRAFAQAPGRRSALFVWHGAEERGLHGSRWHVANPVVPKESIVAVLNADMIGRNHPDTASLLGSQPPNRNSSDLVEMALAANADLSHFVIDSIWDRPTHPEGFYSRSDHAPYARAGIPALFFTSVLHPDYHTPRDVPSDIDLAKLTRITRWMYGAGWRAATVATRPRLDPNVRTEQ